MALQAVVEVSSEQHPLEQEKIIAWAYSLSRTGRVVLVLRGLSRAGADSMLDRIVAAEGIDAEGVMYVDGQDDAELWRYATVAPLVVASTEAFRAALAEHGISSHRCPAIPGIADRTPSRRYAEGVQV